MSVAMVTAVRGVFAFLVRMGMGMRAFIVGVISYGGGAVEPTHFEYGFLFYFGVLFR